MKIHETFIFPCGYKYELIAKGILLLSTSTDTHKLPSCPIHGKDCMIKTIKKSWLK